MSSLEIPALSATPSNSVNRLYEVGKLYCDRGDYDLALPNLTESAQLALTEKNFEGYFKSMQSVLRIYAEREEFEQLSALKEKMHDLVVRENIELTSRVYYTFGIASVYKGQIESALEYFKLSLEKGLKTDRKEDICYAILGIAICYRHQKKFEDALKEIYNLNIFMQFLDDADLKSSVLSANARILMDLKKYDQALTILWSSYELTKINKCLAVSLIILGNIGVCLFELGQKDSARVYFDIVSKSIDSKNGKAVQRAISSYVQRVAEVTSNTYDLRLDFENHLVVEKQLGKINFKNQFILLDLLRLFISRQGEVFSKEYLTENIWKEQYEPTLHDNKIYVTIKRLRKLIEPDFDRPRYIFRSKNGYFLNRSIKAASINHEGIA